MDSTREYALRHTVPMSGVVPFPPKVEETPLAVNRQRIADGIKMLLSALPEAEQAVLLRQLTEAIQPIPAPRAGEVLGTIVQFLRPRPNQPWTVEEIKEGIAARGIEATAKEVYNALGYLTRKQRIKRVGYGQYLVDGALLTTADDLGVEPARDEEN